MAHGGIYKGFDFRVVQNFPRGATVYMYSLPTGLTVQHILDNALLKSSLEPILERCYQALKEKYLRQRRNNMSPAYARLWQGAINPPLTGENVGEAMHDMRVRLEPGQMVQYARDAEILRRELAERVPRDYHMEMQAYTHSLQTAGDTGNIDHGVPRNAEGENRMNSRFYVSNHHIIEVWNDNNVWVTPLLTGEQTYRANFYPEINVAMTPEGMKKAKFSLFPKHSRIKIIKAVEFKDKNFTGFKSLEEFSGLPRMKVEEYCEGYIHNTNHLTVRSYV